MLPLETSTMNLCLPNGSPLGSLSTTVLGLVADDELRQVVCLICSEPSAGFASQAANSICQNMKRKPSDNLTDFAGDFPGGFFWALFQQKEEDKSGEQQKKPAAQKSKSAEFRSAKNRPPPKKCKAIWQTFTLRIHRVTQETGGILF